MSRTIKLSLTEPQLAFHELDCRYPLFLGGFGCGKTEALINKAIMDASLGNDAVIGLYAPTFDLVRLVLMPRMEAKLKELGLSYTVNRMDHKITILNDHFGWFIFRSLDNPERIVSYETHRAHVDELDTLKFDKAMDAWNKIIGRNRLELKHDKHSQNKVCAYTTPEGYNFAYDRWVKNKKKEYQMVRAPSYSNPFLPDDYVESLMRTYPAELVKTYIEGEFENLQGGNVYSSYDRTACRSNGSIRDGEPLYIGCDFNVNKQAATVYVRREGGRVWHAVDELVDMYDTPEMISIIQERWPDRHIVMYPDATGSKRSTVNAATDGDIALLRQAKFEVRAHKSNPFVKDRVLAANAAFSHGILKINDAACPTVARCLEQQAYNKNGEPDKQSGQDHQNDATTYPIAFEMPIRKPAANIEVNYSY